MAYIRMVAPLVMANWTNEEKARFVVGATGLQIFAGVLSFEAATTARDRSGVSIA